MKCVKMYPAAINARTVPATHMMVMALYMFLPKSLDNRAYTTIPVIPPAVLTIKSVTSLRPMARIYCNASRAKLVRKIGIIRLMKFHFGASKDIYSPKGTKITMLEHVSEIVLKVPLSEPKKGIGFIILRVPLPIYGMPIFQRTAHVRIMK